MSTYDDKLKRALKERIMEPTELDTLRTQNAALLAALERMAPDYEHCAPDEDGNIEPDRVALMKQARAAIAAAKGETQ